MYRIITEDKCPREVQTVLDQYVDGYTMYRGIGRWKSKREFCLIIELGGQPYNEIKMVAKQIAIVNQQESVVLQWIQTHEESIRSEP